MLFPQKKLLLFILLLTLYSLNASSEVVTNAIATTENDPIEKTDYRFYDVEVILFKQNNRSALNSEYWAAVDESEYVSESNSEEMGDQASTISPQTKQLLAEYHTKEKTFIPHSNLVSFLAKENYKLSKEAEHIRYSKKYNLLTHMAWRQAGLDKNNALPVKFNFNYPSDSSSGEIKIILSRYLHAEVNFNLIEQVCRTIEEVRLNDKIDDESQKDIKIKVELAKQQSLEKQNAPPEVSATNSLNKETKKVCQLENIQFKQSRKMRSKELHYLDHPVWGLLIQIFPAKLEQQPE